MILNLLGVLLLVLLEGCLKGQEQKQSSITKNRFWPNPGFPGQPSFPQPNPFLPRPPFGFFSGTGPISCTACWAGCQVMRGDFQSVRLERYQSSLYYFSEKGRNSFNDAEWKCRVWFRGHLASIHTDSEYRWIRKKFHKKRKTSEWRFGGHKPWGFWMWTDNSFKFWSIKWKPGHPKRKKSLVSRTGGVVDVSKSKKIKYFVCKKPCSWIMPRPIQQGGQKIGLGNGLPNVNTKPVGPPTLKNG